MQQFLNSIIFKITLMKRINLLLAIMVFACWANATTYLVQPGGSGAVWSGVSGTVVDLSSPALSLNEWYAATTFTSSDQIWIIKGTYTLTDSIVTKTTENVFGGFAGTEQALGDRVKGTNAWDFTNETIIDGNALVRGIVSTTGATIDGLSVQNCAYPSTAVGGNAAAVKITRSSILQNCIVRNNTITGPAIAGGIYAGGVYLTTGAKLLNSYIHHNSCANASGGGNGGGVSIYQLATVDGCSISNNTAYNSGGGVNILAKTGGAVVNNCIISNNTTTNGSGGGVNAGSGAAFTAGLSLTISNCTIFSNTAKINGGGMFLDVTNNGWEGNPINVTKCIISSNTATGTTGSTGNGGGLYLSRGIFNVSGCTINSNISTANTTTDNNGGGGIFTTYSNGSTLYLSNSVLKGNIIGTGKNVGSALNPDMTSITVRNCLITGNIGATFHTQGYGRLCTYQNCTIAGNVTSTGGEAALNLGSGVNGISTFTNCLFYKSTTNPISGTISGNNNPIVTYCGFDLAAVPVTYMTKTGCITGLTATSFTDAANGDWSLSPTSAAINAGTTIPAVTTDITGTLRPQGTGYDIGAYETPSAISSFTPTSGVNGTTVTITGTNLTGATAVSFGGTPASSFIVNSDTQITATVGLGGTGNVSVTTPGGIGTLAGFTCTGYLPAPVITSYTPLTGASGTSVTITGTNLTGATAVSFGGIAAKSITSNSATQIIAKTNSASVGIVSVTTPSGTGSLGAPTITSFTPTTAGYTASVVITGTFLTGTSAVKFGGTAPISYIVNSDTQITAILSSGTSGNVTVTTPLGTGTLAGFVWFSPTISSFTPTSGVSGTSVVITGTNLTGATAVSFGLTAASSFLVNSDTQITAEVSGSVTQGNVSVTTPYGTAYRNGFNTAPVISSFTPASAGNGVSVVINGSYFSEATAVKFGNNAATSFVINSDSKITAIVGSGSTGNVYVTTGGGTGSKTGFTWVAAPTISSFTPTSGGSGTSVVITGTLLTGATAISFGGTGATSFVVNSATQITAVVGTGSTGSVSVTTPGGTVSTPGFSSTVTEIDNTEAANLTLSVYKNATGQIIINRDETIGSEGVITIYNALGNKLVHSNTTGKITVINKSFGSGIYLVSINVAGKNITRKVIIN